MGMNKKQSAFRAMSCLLGACVLFACAFSGKVVKSVAVENIPQKKYEKIIRLDTPAGMPLEPDAGFVYIEPGGKVTTDFPRQIVVENLDGLDKYEKLNQDHMQKFMIRDSRGVVRGYYEILHRYRAHLWEKGDDILLQVIIPQSREIQKNGIGEVGVGGPVSGAK